MAEGTSPSVTRKRRKYSKLGCNECKKRKVKCDERKPECWQCTHLGKRCIYGQPSSQASFKSVKFVNSSNRSLEGQYESSQEEHIRSDVSVSFPAMEETPLSLADQFAEPNINSVLSDATILANDLVTSMVDPPITDFTLASEQIPFLLSPLNSSTNWDAISKDLSMISELELYYLKVFYHKVSFWVLPLASSPSENICNELLFDLIIKVNNQEGYQSSCLQSAVVSISAKYLYNTTKLKEHDVIRCTFLKKTIKQLTSEFDSMPQDYLLELKIESLILCVLLLTLDSSSFKTNEMRIHLNGASALLRKYQGLKEHGRGQFGDEMRNKCLLLSKAWFTATETVAFFSLVGTVFEDAVIDDMFKLGLLSPHENALKKMGLLTPNGYNIFLGYSTEVMNEHKAIMKCLSKPNLDDPYNDNLFSLMVLTEAARSYKFVENEFGRIKIDEQLLASYPKQCYMTHKGEHYSVFDSLQQSAAECSFVFFAMTYLKWPPNCKIIQNSARRIWDFISWIFQDDYMDSTDIHKFMVEIESGILVTYDQFRSKNLNLASKLIIPDMLHDFRGMMFQLNILTCGSLFLVDDTTTLRVIRAKFVAFCEYLVENIGAESGKSSLELLFKRWHLIKAGKTLSAEECLKNDAALPFS